MKKNISPWPSDIQKTTVLNKHLIYNRYEDDIVNKEAEIVKIKKAFENDPIVKFADKTSVNGKNVNWYQNPQKK